MSKKRVFDKYDRVLAPESKLTGEEPVWDNCEAMDIEVFMRRRDHMFTFYNYYLEAKDLRPSVLEWMKNKGYTSKQIKHVKSLPYTYPNFTASKICRAMNKGMIGRHPDAVEFFKTRPGLSQDDYNDEDYVKEELEKALRQAEVIEKAKAVVKDNTPSISPIQRLENKIDDKINSEIDTFIDENLFTKETKINAQINIFSLLNSENIPTVALKFVKKKVDLYLDELTAARDGTCDQCVEGYSYLTKQGIKNRIKIFEKMRDDIEKYKITNTKVRTPRKKKTPSAERQVSKLKFQQEDPNLGITSISPLNVIGSKRVVLFNTKYRKLIVLNSSDGLSVSGTSFKNPDLERSYEMTLRKPEENLPRLIKTKNQNSFDKIVKELTTKQTETTGRVNGNCIILKAFN